MKIYVKKPNDTIITCHVSLSHTIKDLKDLSNVSNVSDWYLQYTTPKWGGIFGGTPMILNDSFTLHNYGIRDKSTLELKKYSLER